MTGEAILWCCHVRGPDDVLAAPDYATALKWSDDINTLNWFGEPKPASYGDCLLKAVPAPWPHNPQSHADKLRKSLAYMTARNSQ